MSKNLETGGFRNELCTAIKLQSIGLEQIRPMSNGLSGIFSDELDVNRLNDFLKTKECVCKLFSNKFSLNSTINKIE